MSKQDNVAVQFLKSWRGYNKGEVAGFSQEQAEILVDGKVAELHGKAKKAVAAAQKQGTAKTEKPGAVSDKPDDAGAADGAGGSTGSEDDNARP